LTFIPTEPIGSIPRSAKLIQAIRAFDTGSLEQHEMEELFDEATQETIQKFIETGSPVISDGEQRKNHNFADYAVHGLPNFAPDGFQIRFQNHTRVWPRITAGPFRYQLRGDTILEKAMRQTKMPLKQAVISPSALSLFYPAQDIPSYPREAFIEDIIREHSSEVRACLKLGAHTVQIDFTEGRLAFKIDPSGDLLTRFIQLNNLALEGFTPEERTRIGIHTCPGGDKDSTHSADVDYAELLPSLFEMNVGRFFIEMAHEREPERVLKLIGKLLKPGQRAYVGVIDVLNPQIETPEIVRDRVLEAAKFIPASQLGTTDDCGYCPFCDDTSTTRDTAFAKIRARVEGTLMAAKSLGL